MASVINPPTFFPRRLSSYVPAMAYASDAAYSGETRISFGAPTAASATYLITSQSMTTAGSLQAASLSNSATLDGQYGRNVSVKGDGVTTGTVTVDGWDYLMQPMSETLTLNGTTAVNGNKAFKYIRQVTWTSTSGVNLVMGTGAKLGLPYKAIKVTSEESNGTPATLGTLANPDLTDPATATTNDPRGIYTPNTTPDGSKVITATLMFANDVNSSNNGGLHGIAHFSN